MNLQTLFTATTAWMQLLQASFEQNQGCVSTQEVSDQSFWLCNGIPVCKCESCSV
jgi:hypothetical protein